MSVSSRAVSDLSRLQPVNAHSITFPIGVHHEGLVSTEDDLKRSIVQALWWLPHQVVSHKNVSTTLNG